MPNLSVDNQKHFGNLRLLDGRNNVLCIMYILYVLLQRIVIFYFLMNTVNEYAGFHNLRRFLVCLFVLLLMFVLHFLLGNLMLYKVFSMHSKCFNFFWCVMFSLSCINFHFTVTITFVCHKINYTQILRRN